MLILPSVKLPKSFIAINLSEISPQLFGSGRKGSINSLNEDDNAETFDPGNPTVQDDETVDPANKAEVQTQPADSEAA